MNRLETHFEDVQEGDQAPEWSLAEPLERQHFVRYAGASGDFNPLHYDDGFATRVGFPSVIAQGMFTAGGLSHYVRGWVRVGKNPQEKGEVQNPPVPGKKNTFPGTVDRQDKEGGRKHLDSA